MPKSTFTSYICDLCNAQAATSPSATEPPEGWVMLETFDNEVPLSLLEKCICLQCASKIASAHNKHLPPDNSVPEWLLEKTFAVQYNPNTSTKFLVRLPSFFTGMLDFKPYAGVHHKEKTADILGWGSTLTTAATNALALTGRDHSHS